MHRVMIVDDEPQIRRIAEIALGTVGGWDVISTDSPTDAKALANTEQPDAIILDVMMPEMDGPQVLEQLRQDPNTAGIPVIFMTAKIQTSDREGYLAMGAIGTIPKPFDPMTLSSLVSNILGWSD